MNRLQTPDSDGDQSHTTSKPPDGSAAGAATLPPAYAFSQRQAEGMHQPGFPPPYAVTADWMLLIPHYRKALPFKLALGVLSIGASAAIIALAKSLGDQALLYKKPELPLRANSISYGAAVLAIIWVFFELLVLFGYKYKAGRRGIHPGGHVLFNATIMGVAIVSAVANMRFMEKEEGLYYRPDTPEQEREVLYRLQRALYGTTIALAAIHFVLLCFACVETSMINSGKHTAAAIPMHALPRGRAVSQSFNPEQAGPPNR